MHRPRKLPRRPGRAAQAAVGLVVVVGGGYATVRVSGSDTAPRTPPAPYRSDTRLLRQAVAVPGETVEAYIDGGPAGSVQCREEDAAIVWLQLATPLMLMGRPLFGDGRVHFEARDESGRRYSVRRAPHGGFRSGLAAIRILRGYSKKPKRLTLSLFVDDKPTLSWPIIDLPEAKPLITAAERSRYTPGASAWPTKYRDVVRVSLPLPGKLDRSILLAPVRTTYSPVQRHKAHVLLPAEASHALLNLPLPNAQDAKEVELDVDAYEWQAEAETVSFSGLTLQVQDGEPALIVPSDLETKTKRGWNVRLLGTDHMTFYGQGVPGLELEVIWNKRSSHILSGYAQAFTVDVVSPRPETLGLDSIRIRTMVADDWTGEYTGVSHRRTRAEGNVAPTVRPGPIGPLVLRITRREPRLLFSRRMMVPIKPSSGYR